jgi:hypothetical protein
MPTPAEIPTLPIGFAPLLRVLVAEASPQTTSVGLASLLRVHFAPRPRVILAPTAAPSPIPVPATRMSPPPLPTTPPSESHCSLASTTSSSTSSVPPVPLAVTYQHRTDNLRQRLRRTKATAKNNATAAATLQATANEISRLTQGNLQRTTSRIDTMHFISQPCTLSATRPCQPAAAPPTCASLPISPQTSPQPSASLTAFLSLKTHSL